MTKSKQAKINKVVDTVGNNWNLKTKVTSDQNTCGDR